MTTPPAPPRPPLLRRLQQDRRGAIAMILALALPMLLGFTALGVEAGLWYTIKTQNQTAVDSAALTAAIALSKGTSDNTTLAQFAAYDARANSAPVNPMDGGTTYRACPLTAGNQICAQYFANYNNLGFPAVQVQLSQQLNTTFANVFGTLTGSPISGVTLHTQAVAALQTLLGKGGACMTARGTISISGSATLTLPNCGMLDYATNCPTTGNSQNYAIGASGSKATITAGAIVSEGCVGSTGNNGLQINTPAGSILQQVCGPDTSPPCSPQVMPPLPFPAASGANPPAADLSDPYCPATYDSGKQTWSCTPASSTWPTYSAQLATTVAAPSRSQNLVFASVPTIYALYPGETVTDTAGAIPNKTTVQSATATTVVLSNQLTSAAPRGDVIAFGPISAISLSAGTLALNPGFYQGLTVSGTGIINLAAGTYYFDTPKSNGNRSCSPNNTQGDSLAVSGGTLQQASGSTGAIELVFDCGNIDITGGAITLTTVTMLLTRMNGSSVGSITITGGTGTITAPNNGGTACSVFNTTGCSFSIPTALPATATPADTVNGILVYQNPSYNNGKNTINVEGASTACTSSVSLIMSGAIDSGSNAEDDVSGNGTSPCGTCTDLIAGSFKYSGSVALDTSGCTTTYQFGQITPRIFGIGLIY